MVASNKINDSTRAQIFLDVKDLNGPRLSITEVASRHGVSRSTVSRIIASFDEQGKTVAMVKNTPTPGLATETTKTVIKPSKPTKSKSKSKSSSGKKRSGSKPAVETQRQAIATTTQKNEPAAAEKKATYVMGPTFINLTSVEGKLHTITSKSEKFAAVRSAVLAGDIEGAIEIVDTAKAIQKYSQGMLEVSGETVTYAGKNVTNAIVNKIMTAFAAGDHRLKSLCNFMKRLLDNPSKNSIDLLWGFIEHNDVGIDDDGFIVAWKKVTSVNGKLFDSRGKTIPNDLGTLVKMIRSHVVEDPSVTCTHGLHVGAWSYVHQFSGDTILQVKIAPEDVVSVPTDYNAQKMRVAKYMVSAIVDRNQKVIASHEGAPTRIIRAGQNGVWEEETVSAW